MQTVTLKLPINLVQSAHAAALDRDETVAKIVEDLLTRELSQWSSTNQKKHILGDKVIFALQSLLFRDMSAATSWCDLSDRLEKHGYWLKLTREGLILHTETNGRALCNCADLSFGYVTFVRRFGAGVPRNPYGRAPEMPENVFETDFNEPDHSN